MNTRLTVAILLAGASLCACSSAGVDDASAPASETSQAPVTGGTGNSAQVIEPAPAVSVTIPSDTDAKTAKELEPEPRGEAFIEAVDAGAIVVDLRSSAQYVGGHIPRAQNVDASDPDFVDQVRALSDDEGAETTYAIYHFDDAALQQAASTLREAGVASVVPLPGGVQAWEDAGRLVVAPSR